jgi:hypothetical protein
MRVRPHSGAAVDDMGCRRTRPGDSVRYQPYSRPLNIPAGAGGGLIGHWDWRRLTPQTCKPLSQPAEVPSFLDSAPAKWGQSVLDKLAASGSSVVDLSFRFMLRSDQKIATGTFGQVRLGGLCCAACPTRPWQARPGLEHVLRRVILLAQLHGGF